MVSLDSNHTHEHVLNELNLYSYPLSPRLHYIIAFDTIVEDLPEGYSLKKDHGVFQQSKKRQLVNF